MKNHIRSSSPHTPGPWAYDPANRIVFDAAVKLGVATVEHEGDPAETSANGLLIAAAPSHDFALRQMVAAIEDMLADDSLHITSDCGDLLIQVANIGNAAIVIADCQH